MRSVRFLYAVLELVGATRRALHLSVVNLLAQSRALVNPNQL
jgi:hypothetical protein